MYRGIIFDFDGVLGDSEDINVSAVTRALQDRGITLTPTEIGSIIGRSSGDVVPALFRAKGIPMIEDHHAIEQVRKYYDDSWDSMFKLMPHTEVVLSRLAGSGMKLAIGTTNRRAIIDRFIKRYNFEGIFHHIVTGEMVKRKKPDPEVYLLAAEMLDLPKNDILVVEDTEVGLAAAKAAALKCAVIPNQYSAKHNFSKADWRLLSLWDLVSLSSIR